MNDWHSHFQIFYTCLIEIFYTHYTRGFTKSGKVAEQHLYIVIYKIALLPPSDPIRK
jgi:hypothetical protein